MRRTYNYRFPIRSSPDGRVVDSFVLDASQCNQILKANGYSVPLYRYEGDVSQWDVLHEATGDRLPADFAMRQILQEKFIQFLTSSS